MSNKTTYFAWILLALAIVAWVAVGFFAASIQAESASQSTRASQSSYSYSLASRVTALQSLVEKTATDRAQLNMIAAVDPASLADIITNAEQSAGIQIGITDANSLSGVPVTSPGALSTQAFTFIATTKGSFASMMYAAALLELLPVPSSIQHLELSDMVDTSGSTSGTSIRKSSWQLNAQIKVVTASAL
jgi:hypothetical protein